MLLAFCPLLLYVIHLNNTDYLSLFRVYDFQDESNDRAVGQSVAED